MVKNSIKKIDLSAFSKEHIDIADATNAVTLRAVGLKTTKIRLMLLRVLELKDRPVSAEMIFVFNESKIPLATIYRALSELEKSKLVRKIDLRSEYVFYERTNGRHHHHVTCTSCGIVENIKICPADVIFKEIKLHSKHFVSVTDHTIELFGICRSCS